MLRRQRQQLVTRRQEFLVPQIAPVDQLKIKTRGVTERDNRRQIKGYNGAVDDF